MKNIVKQISFVIFFVLSFLCLASAQQKLGGEYNVTLKKSYYSEIKDSINWVYIKQPDSIPLVKDRSPNVVSVGFVVPINKNFFDLATRVKTREGEDVFLLRVTLENAEGTGVSFNKFYLPEGLELIMTDFSGSDNFDKVSYNYESNIPETEGAQFFGGTLPSDILLKLKCNEGFFEKCILELEGIIYRYKDIRSNLKLKREIKTVSKSSLTTKSVQSCDFTVPCFNDFANWINEINSVVSIVYSYRDGNNVLWDIYSSGTLINLPDYYQYDYTKKPYILTVAHTLQSIRDLGGNPVNVLKYSATILLLFQRNICGGSIPFSPNLTGGLNIIKEGVHNNHAEDYALLQLRNDDIDNIKRKGNVTFAGWDANYKDNYDLSESLPAVSFHHPRENNRDKKYMVLDNIIGNSSNYFSYYNQTGYTVEGSSGGPVFDSNHRIIGIISGGDGNTCSNPTYQRPVGPRFSHIFQNISQYLGTTECIAYSYDPIYAHLPKHCGNCALDEALGEVEIDCGGPCKPCGQWYEENVSIDNERLLANVIQAKTVTTTSGNNITLKSGEASNIFFSESLTLNAGFSVEQGADFSLNTKSYSEPINQVCESMCAPAIPHMICEGYSWFCIAPNTTWVTVKIYQADSRRVSYTKIYEDSFPNFSNNKIILWDGLTGVRTGINWDNTRQYIIELQLQDCEGSIYSINFNDGWFLAFTTSGCS